MTTSTKTPASPNWRHLGILGLLIVSFLSILYGKIENQPYLFSLDPWQHLLFSELGEAERYFSRTLTYQGAIGELPYNSTMRSLLFVLHQISGLDIYPMMRLGGFILRIPYLILVFLMFRTFVSDKPLFLLAATLLVSTSSYFVWRTYILFPENLAILFHMLLLWSSERVRREGRAGDLALVALAWGSIFFIHPRSIFYSGFIVGAYGISLWLNNPRPVLLKYGVALLSGTLFAFPVVWDYAADLVRTITVNVGQNSSFGSVAAGTARYQPAGLQEFVDYVGAPMLFGATIGIIHLLRSSPRKSIHLLLFFAASFGLALGPLFQIYVPTDRMQAYFYLPVIVLAATGYYFLVWTRSPRWLQAFLVTGLLSISVLTAAESRPWFALGSGQIEMADFINSRLANEPDALLLYDTPIPTLWPLLRHPTQICIATVYKSNFSHSDDPDQIAKCSRTEYVVTSIQRPHLYLIKSIGVFSFYAYEEP